MENFKYSALPSRSQEGGDIWAKKALAPHKTPQDAWELIGKEYPDLMGETPWQDWSEAGRFLKENKWYPRKKVNVPGELIGVLDDMVKQVQMKGY